jgi:hypothetical protein
MLRVSVQEPPDHALVLRVGLRASVLKKSTLRLLNAMVTLTPSSLKTRSSGRGRKSGTTLGFPSGSSVYLIFSLIYPLAFPPVAGAKNPNHIVAIGKPDRQDPAFDLAAPPAKR